MPLNSNEFYSLEDKSYVEQTWRFLTKRVILPSDSSDEVMRKVCCLIFGGCFVFGFCGIYYDYLASQAVVGSSERTALLATGIALTFWGFGNALPVLIYVIWTKTAPIWITTYLLCSTTVLAVFVDAFVTFFYCHVNIIALSALMMLANLPLAPHACVVHFFIIVQQSVRDSFYDVPLRFNHPKPYEGSEAERFIFKMAAILLIVAIPLAIKIAHWEQEKLLAASRFNIIVAQDVATHVLAYDCDAITKTLDGVSKDIIIDEEKDEKQPSIVSTELVTAFRNINANLEIWKPLLPEWCLPKDDIETSIELYGGNTKDDDDDDDEHEHDEDEDDKPHRSRKSRHSRNGEAYVSVENLQNRSNGSRSSLKDQSTGHTSGLGGDGRGRFQAVDKRSWEGGSDNSGSENSEDVKQKNHASPQTTILKGSFHHRVIVCRLNLARLPSFLISAYQRRFKAAKKFLPNTSARFNRIMEILLDTANNENATVHSFFSDHVYVSFNATSKAAHSELKAMRFLTTLETQFKKETDKFTADLEKENALLDDFTPNTNNSNKSSSLKHNQDHNQMPHAITNSADENSETRRDDEKTPSPQRRHSSASSKNRVCGNDSSSSSSSTRRLISGAAVSGSCFGQVAGNMKRQQFVLSTFSNQQTFEQACAAGDRGGFVVVCKGIHQSTQQEYEFRGCSCVVPEKYRHLVFGSTYDHLAGGVSNTNGFEAEPGNLVDNVAAANAVTPRMSPVSSALALGTITVGDGNNNAYTDNHVVANLDPLYEVVASKKLNEKGKGDDAWLFEMAGGGKSVPGQKLNDAVLFLCCMQYESAAIVLSKMEKDQPEVCAVLPAFHMMRAMVPVVSKVFAMEKIASAGVVEE